MKKKIYKVISVALALIVAFSVCACMFSTTSAVVEATYFVKAGATGGDGSESKPYATVTDAITAANSSNALIAGDKLNIVALGDVSWGATSTPAHKYGVVVTSKTEPIALTIGNNTSLGGPTTLDNVNATVSGTSGALFLYRYDFTLNKGATLVSPYFMFGRSTTSGDPVVSQTVTINGSLTAGKRIVLGNDWNNVVYSDYLEFTINDPANTYNIWFGSSNGMATYANTKIDIKAAAGITFNSNKNGSNLRYDFSNGFLQILNASATALDVDSGGLADIDDSKKVIVNNVLGIKGLLSFTDVKGKYAVANGYENVKAVTTDETVTIDAVNGELTLPVGKAYNVTADKIPESKIYYVKAGATEGDGTKEKPFANMGEAVNAAVDAGLILGDTLYVKLMGTTEIDWGTVIAHRFKLVAESEDIPNRSTLIIPSGTALMGETEFKNLVVNSTEFHSCVRFNFNNVIFGEGVKSDIRHLQLGVVTHSTEVDGMNVQINFPFNGAQVMLGNEYSATNFTGDVNVGVNHAAANIKFALSTNNGKNTYQNLNFDIKNALSIQFAKIGTGSFEVKGVVQVLNSSPNTITANSGDLALVDDSKKYIINNISGDSNLLEYTDTAGKYKVNSEYEVYAVKTGTTERILPVGGYLTLAAGEYTVKIERDPVVKEYYVSSNGIGVEAGTRPADVGTKNKPVLTVADATRLISQDNLSKIDIAKIIIAASDVVYWGEDAVHCAPTLQIQTTSDGVQATLTNKKSYDLVGNTIFKDVILEITSDYQIIRLNNYDVTFDKGSSFTSATYICVGTGRGSTVDNDINLVFRGEFNPRSFNFTSEYGSSTYNGDINVTIDSKDTALVPVFGGNKDTNTVYNGNINITLLDAKTMNFKLSPSDNANVTFNGSLQLLADSKVELPYAVKTNFNDFQVPGGKWYITNYSDTVDLVQFSDTAGEFNIKDNKKVYVRDVSTEVETENTTGKVSLASGEYMISDKKTPEVVDESHKMLHFASAGNGRNQVYVRFPATAGKTYVYELSYYAILDDITYPTVCEDGNRPVLTEVTIISDEIVDNYHKVVCEFTVPETYTASAYIFAGLQVGKSNEGVLFDQLVYEKGDTTKTNVMLNNNFHYGLDEWALSMSFWGNHWTGNSGGAGVLRFQSGVELLEVMNFDLSFIKELIASGNPQDGEWWNKNDIHEEETYVAYTTAKGTFKDENGKPIEGGKFVLVSTDGKSYKATSNAKGEFSFGKVVVNFYDLYLIDDDGKKVPTGYSSYLEEGTIYTFNVVSNMSALPSFTTREEIVYTQEYITVDVDEDVADDATPTGDLSGTVYTPMREVVPNLKLVIDNVGEVITDENGSFAFASVPVGTYELYTILSNGEKYVLKEITIVENNELVLKLKYDPPTVDANSGDADNGWVIWVIIAAVIALLAVAAFVVLLLIKKKKTV